MKKILILSSSILLSACAWDQAAPPDNTNAAPPPVTAKQIQGKISQGRYLNKIGQTKAGQMSIPASFSVMVPQFSHPQEYQYTQVSDQQGPSFSSVRFGPGWHDQTIYRVTVSRLPNTSPFKSTAQHLLDQTVKRMHASNQLLPIKLYEHYIVFNQHQILFSVFQQNNKTSGEVLTQAIYFWQEHGYLIECWLTGTNTSQTNPITGSNRLGVVKNNFEPFAKFIKSVALMQ